MRLQPFVPGSENPLSCQAVRPRLPFCQALLRR